MDGEHFSFFTIFSSWSAWSVYDRTAQMCGKLTPWENRIASQRCISKLQTCWAVSSRCWSNHSNWQQQRSPQHPDSCICIKLSVNKPPYNSWAVYAGGKSSVITLRMWLVLMYLWCSKPGCLIPLKWSLEGFVQLADFAMLSTPGKFILGCWTDPLIQDKQCISWTSSLLLLVCFGWHPILAIQSICALWAWRRSTAM